MKKIQELLVKPFEVSMSDGKSIIGRSIYHNYIVIICERDIFADLIELEMIDFDVIICIGWLAASYATVDCQTNSTFPFFKRGLPRMER